MFTIVSITEAIPIGNKELAIASPMIKIKGPAIKYILERGTRIARTPKRPKIAPEAPTAGVLSPPNIKHETI